MSWRCATACRCWRMTPTARCAFPAKRFRRIKRFDTTGAVVYAGSFSKAPCPGMRLAFCAGAPEFIGKMVVAKQGSDVHTNVWAQRVCERILTQTDMDAHLARLQDIYRDKANYMMAEMDEKLAGRLSYIRPEGGMFIWATLPETVDPDAFVKKCLEHKLAVVPGSAFYTADADCRSVRLNFVPPQKSRSDRAWRSWTRYCGSWARNAGLFAPIRQKERTSRWKRSK